MNLIRTHKYINENPGVTLKQIAMEINGHNRNKHQIQAILGALMRMKNIEEYTTPQNLIKHYRVININK